MLVVFCNVSWGKTERTLTVRRLTLMHCSGWWAHCQIVAGGIPAGHCLSSATRLPQTASWHCEFTQRMLPYTMYPHKLMIYKHCEHTRRMWSYAYTNTMNTQRTWRLWHMQKVCDHTKICDTYTNSVTTYKHWTVTIQKQCDTYTNSVTTHKHFDHTKICDTYTKSITTHKHFDHTKICDTYTKSITTLKHFDHTKICDTYTKCHHTQTLWPYKNMTHTQTVWPHKHCDHTKTMQPQRNTGAHPL